MDYSGTSVSGFRGSGNQGILSIRKSGHRVPGNQNKLSRYPVIEFRGIKVVRIPSIRILNHYMLRNLDRTCPDFEAVQIRVTRFWSSPVDANCFNIRLSGNRRTTVIVKFNGDIGHTKQANAILKNYRSFIDIARSLSISREFSIGYQYPISYWNDFDSIIEIQYFYRNLSNTIENYRSKQ